MVEYLHRRHYAPTNRPLGYPASTICIADGGNVSTITTTQSIVDGLKSTVAQMVSNTNYEVRPTAIYANPVLLDLIDREMKTEFNIVLSTTEVAAAIKPYAKRLVGVADLIQ